MNKFSRLWGIGAVPSYTVLDPWMIRGRWIMADKSESPIEEVVGV